MEPLQLERWRRLADCAADSALLREKGVAAARMHLIGHHQYRLFQLAPGCQADLAQTLGRKVVPMLGPDWAWLAQRLLG